MTYDNQGKSTVTYEYGDGNFSTFESYGNWAKPVIQCLGSHIKNGGEGGFEPTERLHVRRFSRPELSTTQQTSLTFFNPT